MPFPLFTSQGLVFALNLGQAQLKKYIQKKIDLKILTNVESKIEYEINHFVNNLRKKTFIYLSIAVLNLICLSTAIYLNNDQILTPIAFIISIGFISYMTTQSILNFKQSVNYVQNFEKHIKELLAKELNLAKEEGWKNKLALLLDSKEVQDYYLIVLDKIVITISSWLNQNKGLLYTRVALFFFASMSLAYTARELLTVS